MMQPKKDIFELFKKYLVRKDNAHESSKDRTWYYYESARLMTVAQAEAEIAKALAKILGL